MDVSRAGIAIEKALFRLASLPHPNLLPDPDCCILSSTYVIAVGFLLYSEVVNLESSESHPDVTAGFQTKKEQAE